MDPTRFTDQAPGELVQISLPDGKDWAFVPNPAPRNWQIPHGLYPLLGDAREKLGELNGIGQTLPRPSLLLTPLRQREALHSSSLEGTHVPSVELLRYNLDPQDPDSEADPRNEWREVSNHDHALAHGHKALETMPLCLRVIKEMHAALLKNVRGRDKKPGEFRDRQVQIGSNRRFMPPPVPYLVDLLKDLELYLNDSDDPVNPLVRAYIAHYQFEAIHPFLDGNGRIGRVLLSLCTYLWHGHALPWLYMSAYFDRYKDEYVDSLLRVSTHGDWARWIEFCLRGTVEQCTDAINRCRELGRVRDQLHGVSDAKSSRMHLIIDKLFEWPVFRVRHVMEWCGISRPTAQKDVDLLLRDGSVRLLEGQRPRTYYAPEILRVAYSDDPISSE